MQTNFWWGTSWKLITWKGEKKVEGEMTLKWISGKQDKRLMKLISSVYSGVMWYLWLLIFGFYYHRFISYNFSPFLHCFKQRTQNRLVFHYQVT